MGLHEIISAAKLIPSKVAFVADAHSPEILAVTGTVAIVAGFVWAIKQTPKAMEAFKEHKKTMEDIKSVKNDPEKSASINYTEKDYNHDIFITRVQTAVKIGGIYAGPVACTVGGIGMFYGALHILRERWLDAVALSNALTTSLNVYRGRVRKEVGEEKEKELFHGVEKNDIFDVNKNGEVETKTVNTVSDRKHLGSPYAVLFDEYNPCWDPDAGLVADKLQCMLREVNRRLQREGHLFVSDVYEMLHFKYEPMRGLYNGLTPEQARISRNAGWIYTDEHPMKISFGPWYEDFVQTKHSYKQESVGVLLDFNPINDLNALLYSNVA